MKFHIISDRSCDLGQEVCQQLGVKIPNQIGITIDVHTGPTPHRHWTDAPGHGLRRSRTGM